MKPKSKIIDGNEAAAYIAYKTSEVCAIYPITPSSNMGEYCDEWSAAEIICQATGWAMLFGRNSQEAMDMALIAQASTLKTQIPFLNIFDGFRTSHELTKVELIPVRTKIQSKSLAKLPTIMSRDILYMTLKNQAH